MTDKPTLKTSKGDTLFYKMKTGERIYKQIVKEVSPNGNLIMVEETPNRDIWIRVSEMEILDSIAS